MQVTVPYQRGCGQQSGREELTKESRAHVRDYDIIATCRQAAESPGQRRIVLGVHQRFGAVGNPQGLDLATDNDEERDVCIAILDEHFSGCDRTPSSVRGDPRDLCRRQCREETFR